ncbi:unnamed protein product, partial [Rotaria sp. Silwood1]
PLPDSTALRRMQNRWETEILHREVPRTTRTERSHDRWGTSNDEQSPLFDTNRSTTTQQ